LEGRLSYSRPSFFRASTGATFDATPLFTHLVA
jgi:hypothetical protein